MKEPKIGDIIMLAAGTEGGHGDFKLIDITEKYFVFECIDGTEVDVYDGRNTMAFFCFEKDKFRERGNYDE